MKYLHKDDQNAIVIIREGHHALTVQLVSFIPRLAPNAENIMVHHLVNHVEYSRTVPVRLDGQINNGFKTDLSNAISVCQQKLVEIQQNNQIIEGALRDYEFDQ